jgi:four helix bundle protein
MWPYQRFDAWKVAHDLTLDVYHVTKRWPAEERFGLTAQVRRAAHSIGANIAEGSAKRGSREFRRYLDISIGSLAELSYSLLLAKDLGYLSGSEASRLTGKLNRTSRVLWGLYRSISGRSLGR